MEREYLNYEPNALITYNENESAYGEVMPKLISVNEISVMARSMKRTSKELMDLKSKLESVREYLLEAYEDMGDHAQEIADLLDVELVKEVSVTVTVEYTLELALKPNEDIQEVIDNLSFSISHGDEVTDYTEGDVDWTES